MKTYKASNGMKYRIVGQAGDFAVVELHAQRDKTVFYADTKAECLEWLERNAGDVS